MIDERKTRMMAKLAIYEDTEGKEDIKLAKYYKSDYVRLNVLKTILQAAIGIVCILVIVVLYKSEYLIEKAIELDWLHIGKVILAIFGSVLIFYAVAALVGYSIYYDWSRKRLAKYYKLLKILQRYYGELEDQSEEDDEDEDEDDEEEDEDEGEESDGDESLESLEEESLEGDSSAESLEETRGALEENERADDDFKDLEAMLAADASEFEDSKEPLAGDKKAGHGKKH